MSSKKPAKTINSKDVPKEQIEKCKSGRTIHKESTPEPSCRVDVINVNDVRGYFALVGPLTSSQVIQIIREAIREYKGGEEELLKSLVNEAEGWQMRLEEIYYEKED